MRKTKRSPGTRNGVLALLLGILLFSGCGDGDGKFSGNDGNGGEEQVSYRLDVYNLTANQPFSPPAGVLHTAGYTGWTVAAAPSQGLEQLAEGGDPMEFLAEADADAAVVATAAGSGVVPPGGMTSVTVGGVSAAGLRFTVATMLVNTNDAFVGTTEQNIANLSVGDNLVLDLIPYDAGTEVNTETAATVPGPAGGGEGFNAERSDRGFVSVHPGVVTVDDGLAASALDESHRFQSPVARIEVTRLQ